MTVYHIKNTTHFDYRAGRYLQTDLPHWVHKLTPTMKRKYIEIEGLTHMQLLLVCFDSKKINYASIVSKMNMNHLASLRSRVFSILGLENDSLTPPTIFKMNAEDGDYYQVNRERTMIVETNKCHIM
jgi:hypothetical protein